MSRHHHHEPPPPACCSCGCCGCGCSPPAPCGGNYYPAPPQPASGSDHLLHAIAAHLLLTSAPPQPQAQPQPQPHPQPPPPPPAAHHENLYSSYAPQYNQQQQGPNPHAYPQPPQHHQQQGPIPQQPPPQQHQQGPKPHAYPQPPAPPPPEPYPSDHGQLLLHSLLRRVAALETTLPHCFPSPPPIPQPHSNHHRPQHRAAAHQEEEEEDPPSPPPRSARGGRRPPPSERELAARTIQEHFRRFLARRSRTLRQLKELAFLRSKAASLRGSLSGSGRRCKDPVAVSEAAMGLLLHLDGIQGGDPMIREGKRAVSRELSRILEFVDKVLAKDHEEMALDNGEYPESCHGAPVVNRPIVDKKVSFRCSESQNEADDSSESSSSTEADERKGMNSKNIANGKPGLAAPAPVHMESRRTAGEMR